MLTILIGATEAIRTPDGQIMRVRASWALTPDGVSRLQDVQGLFTHISAYFKRNLRLDDRVQAGISRFIAEYQGQDRQEFDCYAFVNLVYGLPVHTCRELFRYWDIRPLWFRPRRGQIVFLLQPNEQGFCHAAIYIGRGFYISVYGAGGDLEITEMKHMFKDFEAKRAFVALPKR